MMMQKTPVHSFSTSKTNFLTNLKYVQTLIMKQLLKTLIWLAFVYGWPHAMQAQPFNALRFDGEGDWVTLPLAGTNFPNGNTDFTVDLWFLSENTSTSTDCSSNFRRLLALNAGNVRFEIGVCGPNLNIYHFLPGNPELIDTPVATVNNNTWYHLIVTKSGANLEMWLDCAPIFTQTITASTNIRFTDFILGHWKPCCNTENQDWMGIVDEVHLYDIAIPTATICSGNDCPLSGNEAGLVANWTFNEGIASGNNTGLTQVTDFSASAAFPGLLSNFSPATVPYLPFTMGLTGGNSNFIASTAPITYPNLNGIALEIRDYPYQNNLLSSICSGDPAHFCLHQNGVTPGPFSNVTVQWEYFDNNTSTSWMPLASPPFTDYCFPILPGVLTIPCNTSTDGFVDRKYRAVMTVTNTTTGNICTYLSPEQTLQICCPISPATVVLNPSGPYCEGETETFSYSLNSPDPWMMTPGSNVTINWFYKDPIAGTRIPLPGGTGGGTHTVTFPQVPGVTNFCFEVEVSNCNGKMETFSACIPVDPEPECGTIEGCPLGAPQNLMLVDPTPTHLVYEICPGNDAIVCQATPFNDCIPQWQYTFVDPSVATPSDWANMGLSNTVQNTNILPSHLWPAGQTSIYYRIRCNPLSNPSGCDPCFSNIVEISLKSAPTTPIISGPTQVCIENTPVTLSVSNVAGGLTYTWYHDGLSVGTGTNLSISESGCYWVEATDGCYTVTSPQHCVDVCETIATISCPLPPNACADPTQPVTLSACDSYNTCSGNTGSTLQYQWSTGDTSCTITVPANASAVTYTVSVTDPTTGCVGTASQTVVPCVGN